MNFGYQACPWKPDAHKFILNRLRLTEIGDLKIVANAVEHPDRAACIANVLRHLEGATIASNSCTLFAFTCSARQCISRISLLKPYILMVLSCQC